MEVNRGRKTWEENIVQELLMGLERFKTVFNTNVFIRCSYPS